MKKTGSELAVYALEQIGVRYTFGIPGVHNTELYDALNNSEKIEPILVTHEGCASFSADGISRTTDSIGTIVIVPAAGATHAMSGIAEAFLDGIPMLCISGGTRRDTGRHYQLHQLDQGKLLAAVTKQYFLIERHEDIIPTIYKAYEIATSGEPGPVFIELPVELQMFNGEVDALNPYSKKEAEFNIDRNVIKTAVDMLLQAKKPGIYIGWGAVKASEIVGTIAERLVAPVATTLQGLSSLPANHPLHSGVGFGPSAVPAGRNAFKGCDCLLAVGVRFSELATGSYGMDIPENLIHIDINPEVFNKNYPASISIEGDSKVVLESLLTELNSRTIDHSRDLPKICAAIKKDKADYLASWTDKRQDEKVSPGFFFQSLRERMPDDAQIVVDDGKHTFLTAELFPVNTAGGFISPTDFNSMGYCVPAAVASKLANPDKMLSAIVGDGAFMMTGMELITAATYGVGVIVFVFHDGELGQISQFQKIPLNRKTCTVIGQLNVEGVAIATGAHFISMENDHQIDQGINEAMKVAAEGKPVLVDVKIDYSRKTNLTKGVVLTNLKRFPLSEKVRFIGRAIKRQVLG